METVEIQLHHFLPNPWQPRETEDPEHVKKIALSIAADGLMQPPVGRWVFPDGKPVTGMGRADLTSSGMRVQLAFGHSRLAAYKWLEDVKPNSNLAGDWSRMPVVIRDMSDEEMFKLAIGENLARKDLSPIEEALAMTRYRENFGKTSEEIGELFNLSDSGVRNKMRLLKLPEDIKDFLRRGEMREGVARELISISELPEDVRLKAEDQDDFIKPSDIIEAAKSGSNQKAIAEMVSRCMEWIGERILQQPKPQELPAEPEPEPVKEPADAPAPAWMREAAAQEKPRYTETTAPNEPAPQPTFPGQRPGEKHYAMEAEPAPVLAPATPTPAPAPEPEPAPETKPPTWTESTITLTLTFWPDDGNASGRTVMAGARANAALPMMRMYREANLVLGDQLADLLETLRTQQFGGES